MVFSVFSAGFEMGKTPDRQSCTTCFLLEYPDVIERDVQRIG